MPELNLPTPAAWERIQAAVRRLEAMPHNGTAPPGPERSVVSARVEGVLVDDLHAATDLGQAEQTAGLRLKRGDGSGWSDAETVTITNRSETDVYYAGEPIVAGVVNGELRPLRPSRQRWQPWKNNSGADCPACGCIRVDSGTSTRTIRGVAQYPLNGYLPGSYGDQFQHAINGPTEVLNGEYGICTRDFPARVAYASGSSTVAIGPRPGSFLVHYSTPGFKARRITDLTNQIVEVGHYPTLSITGKVTSTGGVADAVLRVYYGGSTGNSGAALTDTGVDLNVWNSASFTLSGTKFYVCTWIDDRWEITQHLP